MTVQQLEAKQQTLPRQSPRTLWLSWVLVSMAGLLVGTYIAAGVFMVIGTLSAIPGVGNSKPSASSNALGSSTVFVISLLAFCAAVAIAGAILGVAQWSVLRGRLANAHQWIWATCIGALVGFGPLPVVLLALFWPLALVTPLAIGVAQWFVLRSQVPRASRWIGANIIGLLTAGAVTLMPVIPIALLSIADHRMADALLILDFFCVPFCMLILADVGLGIWFAITGVTLARLLEQRTAVPSA